MNNEPVASPVGEVPIELAGKTLKLKLGARELVEIQHAFPGDKLFDLLPRIVNEGDFAAIFKVTAIALRRSWPDVTEEDVIDAADAVGFEYLTAKLMAAVLEAFPKQVEDGEERDGQGPNQ